MEINQNNKPVTVTFSDGTVKQVIYDSIEFLEGGNVSLRGHLSDLPTETVVETPKEAPVTPQLPPERPYMRRYTEAVLCASYTKDVCVLLPSLTVRIRLGE